MVIPPARTGNLRTNKKTVIRSLQTKRGILSNFINDSRMLKMVQRKLIPPRIDLTPARWSLKIVKSTEDPL